MCLHVDISVKAKSPAYLSSSICTSVSQLGPRDYGIKSLFNVKLTTNSQSNLKENFGQVPCFFW